MSIGTTEHVDHLKCSLSETGKYVTEASDLRWGWGGWPMGVVMKGETLNRVGFERDSDNDVVSATYRNAATGLTLVVYND